MLCSSFVEIICSSVYGPPFSASAGLPYSSGTGLDTGLFLSFTNMPAAANDPHYSHCLGLVAMQIEPGDIACRRFVAVYGALGNSAAVPLWSSQANVSLSQLRAGAGDRRVRPVGSGGTGHTTACGSLCAVGTKYRPWEVNISRKALCFFK